MHIFTSRLSQHVCASDKLKFRVQMSARKAATSLAEIGGVSDDSVVDWRILECACFGEIVEYNARRMKKRNSNRKALVIRGRTCFLRFLTIQPIQS